MLKKVGVRVQIVAVGLVAFGKLEQSFGARRNLKDPARKRTRCKLKTAVDGLTRFDCDYI
jgi:hypothetical protein